MMTTMPLAQVRDGLSSCVSSVELTHDRIAITRNGRAVAVLIALDDLESLEETLSVLNETPFVEAITAVLAEEMDGAFVSLEDVVNPAESA